jgi:hypothetical protein
MFRFLIRIHNRSSTDICGSDVLFKNVKEPKQIKSFFFLMCYFWGAGRIAQLVEHLPRKREALSAHCSTTIKNVLFSQNI